jgi:hypothetical protein
MTSIVSLIFLILFLAVIIWGGDRLLALLPGNEKLKQTVRIIAIVVLSLYFLSLAAGFFGIALPWNGPVFRHR